jgi:arginine-tRNA-protein transferase
VEDTHVKTMLIEYRLRGTDSGITGKGEGPLIAAALTDVLGNGLSMVYSYFDPFEANRGLGSYMILDHIARARKMGLPFVYLGYWVNGSPKMDYKTRFRPQEHLTPRGWQQVDVTEG